MPQKNEPNEKKPNELYIVVAPCKNGKTKIVECKKDYLNVDGTTKQVYSSIQTGTVYHPEKCEVYGPYDEEKIKIVRPNIERYYKMLEQTAFYRTTTTKGTQTITSISECKMSGATNTRVSQEEAFVLVIHKLTVNGRPARTIATLCKEEIIENQGETKRIYISANGNKIITSETIEKVIRIEPETYYGRDINLRDPEHVKKVEDAALLAYTINIARNQKYHFIEYKDNDGNIKKTIASYKDEKLFTKIGEEIPRSNIIKVYSISAALRAIYELTGIVFDVTAIAKVEFKEILRILNQNGNIHSCIGEKYSEKYVVVIKTNGREPATRICRKLSMPNNKNYVCYIDETDAVVEKSQILAVFEMSKIQAALKEEKINCSKINVKALSDYKQQQFKIAKQNAA